MKEEYHYPNSLLKVEKDFRIKCQINPLPTQFLWHLHQRLFPFGGIFFSALGHVFVNAHLKAKNRYLVRPAQVKRGLLKGHQSILSNSRKEDITVYHKDWRWAIESCQWQIFSMDQHGC